MNIANDVISIFYCVFWLSFFLTLLITEGGSTLPSQIVAMVFQLYQGVFFHMLRGKLLKWTLVGQHKGRYFSAWVRITKLSGSSYSIKDLWPNYLVLDLCRFICLLEVYVPFYPFLLFSFCCFQWSRRHWRFHCGIVGCKSVWMCIWMITWILFPK